MSERFLFQGKYYQSDQGWGEYHPGYAYWFDPYCVKINRYISINDDVARLGISDHENHGKKFGCGELASEDSYLYGTFEWEYILPLGKYVWPAIWLTARDSWPPEIDVMEGWTGYGLLLKGLPNYKRFCGFNNIVPGLVYGTEDNQLHYSKASLGSKSTFSCLQYINKINKCRLEWTPDYIRVYYNGKNVSEITDKQILSYFNVPMRVIMNNAVTVEFDTNAYNHYKKYGRDMFILSFKYY